MWNLIKSFFRKPQPTSNPVKHPWITMETIKAQLTHAVEVERAEFVLLRCFGDQAVLFHWDGNQVIGNYLTFDDLKDHGPRGLTHPLQEHLYLDLSWATQVKYIYPETRSRWNKLIDEAVAIRFAYGIPAETLIVLGYAHLENICMTGRTQWTREGALYLGETLAELNYLNLDVRLLDWVPGLIGFHSPLYLSTPTTVG